MSSSLHGQADATTVGVDVHNLDLDVLADLDDLRRGVDVLGSHLGDVNQTLDVVAKLDEGAERNNLGDLAINDGAHGVALDELQPRILGGLLQAERDALALQVDVENLNLNLVANLDDLGRMVDMVPRQLGDVNQTVDAAQVNEGAEVDDGGNGALEAHALDELGEDFGALVLAAFLEQHAAGQHDVVAVAIHLDDASFDFGAQVGVEILHAAKVNEGSRQEATQADVEDEAALDDFDNLAGDGLAGLELLFDADPSTLVLSTLLGEDQAAVLVFLLENKSLDFVAQGNDLGGIGILADRQLASRDNALALEADVEQALVMLDFHDSALDQIAFVELGQGAIDHRVHLVVGDVLEIDDIRVLDFGQNGPLSSTGTLRHGG